MQSRAYTKVATEPTPIVTQEGGNPRILALNTLHNVPGARKTAKRIGRGPGSGKGKTSTKGHKGMKARRRSRRVVYEGGQMPLFKLIPKRGFKNHNMRDLKTLKLSKLMQFVENGRIDASKPITLKSIHDAQIVGRIKEGVKILAHGAPDLSVPLHLEVTDITPAAQQKIEDAGGSVKLVWYNRVSLRAHLKPEKFDILPRSNGIPPPRLQARYDMGPDPRDAIRQ
jgi:large subunit ribosomal protein L15